VPGLRGPLAPRLSLRLGRCCFLGLSQRCLVARGLERRCVERRCVGSAGWLLRPLPLAGWVLPGLLAACDQTPGSGWPVQTAPGSA